MERGHSWHCKPNGGYKDMERAIVILMILSLVAGATYADPEITSVSGSISHGQGFAISGSGFGVKSPAEPVLWDSCSSQVPLSTYYTQALPSASLQGNEFNMQYRPAEYRSIGSPDGRAPYILTGAHATNHNGDYFSGNVVGLYKAGITSFDYFVQYWYRVDPLFDEVCTGFGPGSDCPGATSINNPPGENMKDFVLSSSNTDFYGDSRGGCWGYYAPCGSHVPDKNFRDPFRIARNPVNPVHQSMPYACSTDQYVVTHNNPVNGWIKMQWEGFYDTAFSNPTVRFTTYPDGHATYQSHYGGNITTFETICGSGRPEIGDLRGLGIGGFARVPRTDNGFNSFRYFSKIYMDDTHARVMLGDNPDYHSCTIMEPQIPSAWSDGSLTVTANLGALPDSGTAYLFVFDSENNHNPAGYPVALGAGQVCGNGICESQETCSGCPVDCPTPAGHVCCSGMLHEGSCCTDADCPAGQGCTGHACLAHEQSCGNGICDNNETCSNCPTDCQIVHEADNDPCDGKISVQELRAYIGLWKQGSAGLVDIMRAIGLWKGVSP